VQQDLVPTRRSVVSGCALAALGLVAGGTLAACGGSSSSSTTTGGATPSGSAPGSAAGSATPTGGEGDAALAALDDVPVGGALRVEGPNGAVILAQPEPGRVVGWSAVCTHQGALVAPKGDVLRCPLHESTFDPATGKVLSGLAKAPLPAVPVKVQGSDIVLG
jgi:nitrite reductase/ring-hydroxylating ferredoxin subunit